MTKDVPFVNHYIFTGVGMILVCSERFLLNNSMIFIKQFEIVKNLNIKMKLVFFLSPLIFSSLYLFRDAFLVIQL